MCGTLIAAQSGWTPYRGSLGSLGVRTRLRPPVRGWRGSH
jgi:hypothetical protein